MSEVKTKVVRIYKGKNLIAYYKGKHQVLDYFKKVLIYKETGSTIDKPIPFAPGKKYEFHFQNPTWLIEYTASKGRQTIYATDGYVYVAPSDFQKANFYDNTQAYTVYEIVRGI